MSVKQDKKKLLDSCVGMLFYDSSEVLRKEFGFGKSRLIKFIYRVGFQLSMISDDFVTYEEYIDNMKEEINLDDVILERSTDNPKKAIVYMYMDKLVYNIIYALRDGFGFGENRIKKFLKLYADEIRNHHNYDELGNKYWNKYNFKFSVKYMTLRTKDNDLLDYYDKKYEGFIKIIDDKKTEV